MAPPPAPENRPRIDVLLALYRAVQVFWLDFASVIAAGVLLVTLPGALTHHLPNTADWGTLTTTLRGVCAMLYVALVSWGVVARLAGRALPPRRYLSEGLARATPGVQVALLIGAMVVAGLTLQLFARHGTFAGWLLNSLLLTAALLAVTTLMPAVPAAVVERLGPMAALRRAAALTAGHRDRLLALALLVGVTLAPSAALVAGVGGSGGGIWLRSIFELVAWSLAATVPAVVYALLREPARESQ
ncbi:hypothetical protein [Polymorphobacter fuscus]|uniref:Uncharacterized protein n=1 Tax=Sandarakinorhabdus fusca TaxID=1439888 RepID=A0A7C9KXE3_9SPHN|nr:hypothetical protein [Polymorphobacter fuscus]KAB7647661.1 hypothetical protein F9290_06705 [Polymorphobacter fuscus]MQT16946.1 hypothetical protein [Polymorphobacter fuscus]NJC09064.1 hypothetical protein [Polymorphobacter fuscus]